MKSVQPGLSLIEVVLAVLMLGIATTSLLGLQGTLLRGVFSAHSILDRLGFIRSFFVTADKDRLFKKGAVQTKVLEDPTLTLKYVQKRPASKALSAHKHLVVEQVEAEWPTPFGTRKDFFARLAFKPQKGKAS